MLLFFPDRMNFINQFLTRAKPHSLALLAMAKVHSQTLRNFVARHPKHVTTVLAAVLLGGGGGAFAVANLGPDASNLPVSTLVEPLQTPDLEAQVAALEQQTLKLYRNDITRGSDTAESLLRRLGLVDSAAANYIRKTPEVRQALLNRSGRNVSVEANEQQQLLTLTTRWLKNDSDSQFQRMVITRNANNEFSVRTDTAPLTASVRMAGGTVASSLYAASDEARLPDTVTRQLADVFSGQIDFHRALRKGAVFSVVYETLEAEGEPLRTGRLLSAEITNDKKPTTQFGSKNPAKKGPTTPWAATACAALSWHRQCPTLGAPAVLAHACTLFCTPSVRTPVLTTRPPLAPPSCRWPMAWSRKAATRVPMATWLWFNTMPVKAPCMHTLAA